MAEMFARNPLPIVLSPAATQTVTDSVALTADTALVTTLKKGGTYSFEAILFFTTVASSGVQVDMGGGTATFTSWVGHAEVTDLATYTGEGILGGGAMATADTAVGVTITGITTRVVIKGAFVVNAAGTVGLRFALNLAAAPPESVIRLTSSSLTFQEIA